MNLHLPTLLLLQSNDLIARAIADPQHLLNKPHIQDYGGITGTFAVVFLQLIHAVAGFVHNYGFAIMLSAVLVRLALLPLTRQQIRGMKVMQVLQPVMKAIQAFWPTKQDQGAKTMELYQKYKINPLAGCLPLFIQLPVLFGVYQALYDPSFAGKNFLGIQLLFPVNVASARNMGHGADLHDVIDVTVAATSLQGQFWHIPTNIPLLGGQIWYWPALALVALYIITSLWMQKLMKKVNQPDKSFEEAFMAEMKLKDLPPDPNQDMANQMQKTMGLMNFMIIILAFIFSAGALLYYIVQNCVMMLEYTFLPRGMELALDPKELKTFIKQPPVTPSGPAAAQDRKEDAPPKRIAEEERLAETSEEDRDGGDGPGTSGGPLKPRPRKRRKR
jgi:YidC/Oxa1 family membrane protein insertase